jgi:DNA-binding transcriptional ArsR family regulator
MSRRAAWASLGGGTTRKEDFHLKDRLIFSLSVTDEKDEAEEPNEKDAKKAQLIRNLIVVTVFASAVALGYFVELPVWSFGKDKKEDVSVEQAEKEIREALAAENRLTILNAMVDGNPDSKKLKELLAQLEENKYGDRVESVDFDAEVQKGLAEEHAIDLDEFAGQLDFYAGGYKLGTLKGETDPVVVEKTIDRYLAGLVKRFGPDWLPKVQGMQRVQPNAPALAPAPNPKTIPSGVPGMERTVSGVPGMTRAKPGQKNIQVEPADGPKK